MHGRYSSRAGIVLISPSHAQSASLHRKASSASIRLTASESAAAHRRVRTRLPSLSFALMRVTAAGRPETTGVMSSICALCASSQIPIACAPSSRESQIRSRKPSDRTTKCEQLRNIVFLTSERTSSSPVEGMRSANGLDRGTRRVREGYVGLPPEPA